MIEKTNQGEERRRRGASTGTKPIKSNGAAESERPAETSIVDSSHLDHKSTSNWVVCGVGYRSLGIQEGLRTHPTNNYFAASFSLRSTLLLLARSTVRLVSVFHAPNTLLSLDLFGSFLASGQNISRGATSTDALQDKWPRDGGHITFQNWPNRRLSG